MIGVTMPWLSKCKAAAVYRLLELGWTWWSGQTPWNSQSFVGNRCQLSKLSCNLLNTKYQSYIQ